MDFYEQDLEDLIYEASQTRQGREKMEQRGLWVEAPLNRQVGLGSYGVLDLLEVKGGPTGEFIATAYELKKGELKSKHLMQLCRYVTALKLHFRSRIPDCFRHLKVKGQLIGRSVKTNNDFCFLVNEIGSNISVKTYDFDMEYGLTFNESYGWKNTDQVLSDLDGLITNISTPLAPDYFDWRHEYNQKKQLQNGQK